MPNGNGPANWGAMWRRAWPLIGLALALSTPACQTPPAQLQVQKPAAGSVNFTIHVPKKSSKQVRRVQATGTESSTLLVNRVDVSLSGPGFFQPIYPPGTESSKGAIDVQSGSVSSRIDNVPTGKNRFIRVVAKNGAQKLNQVAGVLDVQPGPYNHVVVGLSTTPTANVIEKLALKAPEAAQALSAKQVQYYLDTHVTRPVVNDATKQNTFNGFHPYLVNADGLVDYLIANNNTLPADFAPATLNAHRTFVLNAGTVRVQLDAPLPAGSRLWLNDPTSAIYETTGADAAKTEFVIPDVAPNFERTADETLPPAWTLAIMTPDGRLTSVPVTIARKPLSEGTLADVVADLRGSLKAIKRIYLSPSNAEVTSPTVAINGRRVQQLFVYAVYDEASGEKVVPLLPNALTWESLDPTRLKVGNGGAIDGTQLDPALSGADAGLGGLSLEDYGLVYPLAETDATTPTAMIKGSMKGNPALTASIAFTVGHLGATTGRVQLDVAADGIQVTGSNQIIPAMDQPVSLSVSEPLAPAGTTYRWVSDHPLISVGAGTGRTLAVHALGSLPLGQQATLTVTSSTGRKATAKVGALFSTGTVSGSAAAGSVTARVLPFTDTDAANADLTLSAGEALKAYLNSYMAEATIGAADSADASAKFFWFSSNPTVIAVSGSFPSVTATVKALRPGTATVSAMDLQGRVVTGVVKSNFTRTGTATGAVTAPENGIALSGTSEAAIGAELNAVFATRTYAATEKNVGAPAFLWQSLDATRLVIEPPAGQSFPHAQATFKAVRPGAVSFRLVSAVTGETRTFTVTTAFASSTATGAVTAPQLILKNASGTPVTSHVGKTLGQLVDFSAADPSDPAATFVWTSDNAAVVAVEPGAAGQMRARLLDYGTTTVRVVNTRNGRWGLLNFDIQKTGKGTGNITVTL